MSTPKKPSVKIAWGSEATREERGDDGICEYEFNTQAELTAFLEGIDQASGWTDYEIVERSDG